MMMRWKALSLSLPLLLGACNSGERSVDRAKPEDGGSKDAPAPAPAPSPMAMFGPMAGMLANKLEEPGPYDAPVKSANFDKTAPHYLTFDLHGVIDDLSPMNLLGGGGGVTELRALTDRLHKAAADPNVRGLVLRVDAPEIDMASAEDLLGSENRRAVAAILANAERASLGFADATVPAATSLILRPAAIRMAPRSLPTTSKLVQVSGLSTNTRPPVSGVKSKSPTINTSAWKRPRGEAR